LQNKQNQGSWRRGRATQQETGFAPNEVNETVLLDKITVEKPYPNEEPTPPFPFDEIRTGGTPPRAGTVIRGFGIPLHGRGGHRPGWVIKGMSLSQQRKNLPTDF